MGSVIRMPAESAGMLEVLSAISQQVWHLPGIIYMTAVQDYKTFTGLVTGQALVYHT